MCEQQKHEKAYNTCNENVTAHHCNGTCERPHMQEQWKACVTTIECMRANKLTIQNSKKQTIAVG